MPALQPFRAVLYAPSIDPDLVTTPPYDVIAPGEQARLEGLDPHNMIRLILPREEPGDQPGADRWARSAATFREWLAAGVLVADDEPHLFAYQMQYTIAGQPRVSGGVIGALTLEDLGRPDAGSAGIWPHEHTLPKPRSERLDLTRAAQANLEPIWLVGGDGVVGQALEAASERPALVDFSDPAGVRHRLWRLTEGEATPVAAGIDTPLAIADGHHRYGASLTLRDELRATNGPGPWDATLALVSDPTREAPALLPIHRMTDLSLDDIAARADLIPFAGDLAELVSHLAGLEPGTVGVATRGGRWTLATGPHEGPDSAWVMDTLLQPTGAGVVYEHDVAEIAAGIDAGRTALLLVPIPIAVVIETALAGGVMPPKSTLFWPKPRTGIVLRDFLRP